MFFGFEKTWESKSIHPFRSHSVAAAGNPGLEMPHHYATSNRANIL